MYACTHTHTHAKQLSFWFEISDQNMYVMCVCVPDIYLHAYTHYVPLFNIQPR